MLKVLSPLELNRRLPAAIRRFSRGRHGHIAIQQDFLYLRFKRTVHVLHIRLETFKFFGYNINVDIFLDSKDEAIQAADAGISTETNLKVSRSNWQKFRYPIIKGRRQAGQLKCLVCRRL